MATREANKDELNAAISVDMAPQLRKFLSVAEGGGATVVRIEEIRAICGWQNDLPIIVVKPVTQRKRLPPTG